jgi:hypothetical protein
MTDRSLGLSSFDTSLTGRIALDPDIDRRLQKMRRGVICSAKIIQDEMTEAEESFRVAFITLTYRPGVSWESMHIADLVQRYRMWCKRRGIAFRYVWVLELTRAGVPHYHIAAWLPRGITPPLPDKAGWWPHGMTQAKWARSPVGYLAKYASKGADGSLPRDARLWACGGMSAKARALRCWSLAPRWLRRVVERGSVFKRLRCGWWEDKSARIRFRTPWDFDKVTRTCVERAWTTDDIVYEMDWGRVFCGVFDFPDSEDRNRLRWVGTDNSTPVFI